MIEFEGFPKISRLFRDIMITEKIDGTNAQIIITEDGEIRAASRTRLITAMDDNFGFARWVDENKDELLKLGIGRHFGEWWGASIGRKYGRKEKTFSLFNAERWNKDNIPNCVSVVPILYKGTLTDVSVTEALAVLREKGSLAAPGFMNPEGIVMWHTASRQYYKVTLDNDALPKGVIVRI